MRRAPFTALTLSSFVLAALLQISSATAQTNSIAPGPSNAGWVGTWATAPFGGDPWRAVPTLVDSTLREIVHTSIAGSALRIHFTNEFGTEPLRIDAATVALSAGQSDGQPGGQSGGQSGGQAAIQPASLHAVTFNGKPSIVIPAGAQVLSDSVDLATPAFADLAISFYLPLQQVSNVSNHSSAQQTNYIQTGNQVSAPSLTAPVTVSSWYFIKSIDVQATAPKAAAIVAFGDSITDGAYATQNQNHRWPDDLALRLHNNPATANLSVLNEGIGGNCVLIACTGPNALARFDRDVLSQTGVRYVIILEGINDIGRLHDSNRPDYHLTAEDMEQGLSQLAARAHQHGIKIFAATITPYQGAGYSTDKGEQIREAVNTWILTSGVFDGAIDFDKATSDPAHPLAFAPQYDSGDHLHPKDAGYAAMADSIDLSLFR